jgi:hypothetical protein
MAEWAVQQIVRENGVVEDICKCGIGHPNADWVKTLPPYEVKWKTRHGCCGCCSMKLPPKNKFVKFKVEVEDK